MTATAVSESRPLLNHVFVDGENVPDLDLSFIRGTGVHVTLLLGPRNTRLPVENVELLIAHAPSVHFIRLETPGKNALDFALAYYLGRAVHDTPGACFHIVSKDQGFAPLVAHLKARQIQIEQHADSSTLPFGRPIEPEEAVQPAARAKPKAKDQLEETIQYLRKRLGKNPKTRLKLISDLKAHHGKGTTDEQMEKLVDRLVKAKQVSFDPDGKATYHLKQANP